ncbi:MULTISPECIES: Pycsar system effector family protein [unclassified Saccharicrinis]|uniref:Pycsar system effector family protein n=1 Tax=unclassified Saccharicrinis TaxID=2646859 RepID=UPI003D3416AB
MVETTYSTLVNECIVIASDEITANQNGKLYHHNLEHTLNVLEVVTFFAENIPEISEKEKELLQIAALFHDVCFCKGVVGHEKNSAAFARRILKSKNMNHIDILTVERIIMSTKLGYKPTDLLEKTIKDADIAHIGKKDYFRNPFIKLYKEINSFKKKTPQEWINDCIVFFEEHPFYTKFAQENLNPQKEKNKEKLKALSEMEINSEEELIEQTAKKKDKKKKKKVGGVAGKTEKPDKGIETMFRVNLRNHVNLSRIADDKANTLISVNGIIISIVLSTLFPKLDNNEYLIWPALILVAFSIVTIIIAIISTIPRTTHGFISKEDISHKRGNLTFFGNFHRMELEDFEWGIGELMKDRDYLYNSMSRDLYFLGKVLNKKYAYLRWGYIVFVTGLVFSILFFVIGIMNYQQ